MVLDFDVISNPIGFSYVCLLALLVGVDMAKNLFQDVDFVSKNCSVFCLFCTFTENVVFCAFLSGLQN